MEATGGIKMVRPQNDTSTPGEGGKSVRVVLYPRVSTARQASEGVSIDAQPDALREYSRRQGWQLTQAMTRLQAEVFVFDRLELRGAL
jgi:hypothetical protein